MAEPLAVMKMSKRCCTALFQSFYMPALLKVNNYIAAKPISIIACSTTITVKHLSYIKTFYNYFTIETELKLLVRDRPTVIATYRTAKKIKQNESQLIVIKNIAFANLGQPVTAPL